MGRLRGVGTVPVVLSALLLATLIVQTSHQLSGHDPSSSTLGGPPFAHSYTCCAASLVNTMYHPGETIVLHWLGTPGVPARQAAAPIALSMRVSGPYRTIASLKTDSVGATPHLGRTTVSAAAVRVMNTAIASPTSTLHLPSSAGSGYYNLTWEAGTRDLSIGGGSVIRVAAPTH